MWTTDYSKDTFITLPSLLGVMYTMQLMERSLLEKVPTSKSLKAKTCVQNRN